jgi:VanZ family protein
MWRVLFFVALALTLVALLLPAPEVLALKKWVAAWLPGGLWVARENVTDWAHADKLVHAGMFAVLGGLATSAWREPRWRVRWWWALLALGVLTEVLQAWVPGRSPSGADVLADALGLGLGVVMSLWLLRAGKRV